MSETNSSRQSSENDTAANETEQVFEEFLNDAEDMDSAEENNEQSSGASNEFDVLQSELSEAKDQLVRAQAEVENVRKRARRDMAEQSKYSSLPLMAELVEVVDNLDRALQSAEQSNEQSSLLEGVKMVASQLTQLISNKGCERIQTVGHEFDPNLHEAIQVQPSHEFPAQVITYEARPGYKMHDRVIRAAQVIISSGAPE